jgi:hypothetical protein
MTVCKEIPPCSSIIYVHSSKTNQLILSTYQRNHMTLVTPRFEIPDGIVQVIPDPSDEGQMEVKIGRFEGKVLPSEETVEDCLLRKEYGHTG